MPGKPFRSKHTYRPKVWGMEKGIPHKWKSAEKVAIFISDKIDFKDCYKRQKYTLHNNQGIGIRR